MESLVLRLLLREEVVRKHIFARAKSSDFRPEE
jgi:hypothetical protein